MDIHVNNLDLGYEQCESLNTLSATKGEALLNSLSSNIENLRLHWKGSDATLHINNLIRVYNALGALLTDAKIVTASAGDKIIAIQRIRNANGGGSMVGSELSKAAPNIQTLAAAEGTTEYYCDPSAKTDYEQLETICNEYQSFVNTFREKTNDLLANWTAGANREGAVARFNEFAENTDTYKTYLTDAKGNLSTAVSNLSQL